jgi:DNA topoisomerase IA
MANSAHDEISILSKEVEALKQDILTQEPKQAKKLNAVLNILTQWQLARDAGDAVVTNQTYYFEGKDSDGDPLFLKLNAQTVEFPGWTEYLQPGGAIRETGLISAFERYALTDSEQSVDMIPVSLPEQENMTFLHFAEQLEAFSVGRPSTYASIFDSLIKAGLMDMQGGTIRITNLGAKAHEELQLCFALDALSVCTTFDNTMKQLGRGEVSLQFGTHQLLRQWDDSIEINDVFSSLDDINFDGLVE